MRTIHLHVGMHKTGSSSIQATLASADLSRAPFRYADLGSPNHSRVLAMAVMDEPHRWTARNGSAPLTPAQGAAEQARHRDRIAAAIAADPERDLVFSGEAVTTLDHEEVGRLVTLLEPHGNLRVIAYVREPRGFLESSLQQRIKSGLCDFAAERTGPIYRHRFESLEAAVGRERITYVPYERDALRGRCVVQDFCLRIGLELDPAQVVIANEGISQAGLALLMAHSRWRRSQALPRRAGPRRRRLTELCAQLPGAKLVLSEAYLDVALGRIADDIAWMEARMDRAFPPANPRDGGIDGPEDLLAFDLETTRWLAERIGPEAVQAWSERWGADEVGTWMEHLAVAGRAAARGGGGGRQREIRKLLAAQGPLRLDPELIWKLCRQAGVPIRLANGEDPATSEAVDAAVHEALRQVLATLRTAKH